MLRLTALAPAEATADEPAKALRVTVTVPPLVWLVSEVAGHGVEVGHMVDVGDSPETFQPTDQRITGVARSALFFRVGIPVENGSWLRTLEKNGRTRVVDLRQGLELREVDGFCADTPGSHAAHASASHATASHASASHASASHETAALQHHDVPEQAMDPHIWLSPRRLQTMAATIARHLAEVDPQRAGGYTARAAEITARLQALDAELRDRLAPVHGRTFFVFHPAWGYFADDYGLHQVAIEIEGKEPTEAELTHLVREAREHGMRALFVQPQSRSATPRTLARTLSVRMESLDPLAADLPANLRHVAESLRAAMLSPEEGE